MKISSERIDGRRSYRIFLLTPLGKAFSFRLLRSGYYWKNDVI
jgi:hypothetical protein